MVLGGGIMGEPYILSQLERMAAPMVKPSFRGCRVVPAALGNNAGLMGGGISCGEHRQRLASAALGPHGLTFPASGSCRNKGKKVFQMEREKLQAWRDWVRAELESCVSFWLEHGMDKEHGGVYTCLTRDGKVFSTDKSVWMQGRCAWTFSYLCRVYGKKQEWLDAAKSCPDFLEEHCINRTAGDRLYFTVTADGKPLRQRRYCFSEGFYAIGNAEYYGQTGEREHLERARKAYQLVYDLNHGMPDPTEWAPKPLRRRARAAHWRTR